MASILTHALVQSKRTISRKGEGERGDALNGSNEAYSSSDRVLSEFIVVSFLLCAGSHSGGFEWSQTSAVRSGSLSSQVFRCVSALLVSFTGSSSLLLGDNSEALCDSLSHGLDLGKVNLGLGRDLAHTELLKLFLYTQIIINSGSKTPKRPDCKTNSPAPLSLTYALLGESVDKI